MKHPYLAAPRAISRLIRTEAPLTTMAGTAAILFGSTRIVGVMGIIGYAATRLGCKNILLRRCQLSLMLRPKSEAVWQCRTVKHGHHP